MTHQKDHKFSTKAIHGAVDKTATGGSRNMPIHQTVCYHFDDAKHAADLFGLEKPGFIYSRLTNPTTDLLQKRLAIAENGVGATASSSGLSAQFMALFPLMTSGDEFIASRKVYGGSGSQFKNSFKKFNWKAIFVAPENTDGFKDAITDKTKAIFVESVSNPSGAVPDFKALAKIAHSAGIPLIVDNTIATPALFNPIDVGADLVTHSLTKYISGQSTSMGGIVVDSGNVNWARNDKFPSLSQPDDSYHGLAFYTKFGKMAFTMYCHAVVLRDFGMALAPMNAHHIMLGLETLDIRMQRHVANDTKVAEFLDGHKQITYVSYTGLKSHPSYKRAKEYMPHGTGGLFTFGLKNPDAGKRVVENATLFHNMAHIGDASSFLIHPASTTHMQLTLEEQKAADAGPEVIRCSVGLEDANDLIADLDQAIAKAVRKN